MRDSRARRDTNSPRIKVAPRDISRHHSLAPHEMGQDHPGRLAAKAPLAPAAKEATRPQRREGEGKRRARRARSALPSLGGRVGNYGHRPGRGTATLCDGEDISTDKQAKVQQGDDRRWTNTASTRTQHKTVESWYSAVTPLHSWSMPPEPCSTHGPTYCTRFFPGSLDLTQTSAPATPALGPPASTC